MQNAERQWAGNAGGERQAPAYRARRLPLPDGVRQVNVFVEGYEDVSFWRGILGDYETDTLRFEISVPQRADLAKGKKVLLGMEPECPADTLLCMDSDFDYLFGGDTEQSRTVNSSPSVLQTYAYASENLQCYAPSLHAVCVRATKNDTRIFDFEYFMREYSRIIYPLFVWYVLSARVKSENFFTLMEFKTSVKLNYLEVEDNGRGTLAWLARQVEKRAMQLESKHPAFGERVGWMEERVAQAGVVPEETYLYMQGHTLFDNVVIVMLHAVCEQLKIMSGSRIMASQKSGVALRNEQSNYANAQRNVRDILLDNEGFKECHLYGRLRRDIERFVASLG